MSRLLSWLALAAFSASFAAAEPPSTRRVWADAKTNLLGGLSADGKLLSYVEPATGDLAVYELATGETRALTRNPKEASTFAYFSAFSRDSKTLAYAWFNEQGFYELWTIDVGGGEPRRLYSNPENGFVQPCDWSLDGSQILTLFFRKDNVSQIALVSAADGSVRVLKTLSWFYPKKISFSPDGRYILYDSLIGRDETARDILLLDADGSGERKLIEHDANDIFPLWTPAGDGVVFASDRSGEMDLWLAAVRDGQVAGEPRPIARQLGRALPIGVTPDGAYYFGLRAGRSDVKIAPLLGEEAVDPVTAGLRTVGRNSEPAWSRDGRRLAFLTQLGTENYGQESRGIAVWAPASREETVLAPRLASIAQLRWSPDGERLLASGSDGRGRSGLFTVDPETGETDDVVRTYGGGPRGLEGAWLDAETVAHVAPDRSKVLRLALSEREGTLLYQAEPGWEIRPLAADHAGERIVFGLVREGEPAQIRTMQVAGGEQRLLMTLSEPPRALEISGETLYATAPSGKGEAVWSVPLSGGKMRKTALPPGLRFSPDGKRIAYVMSDRREEVWALEGWLEHAAAQPSEARSEAR